MCECIAQMDAKLAPLNTKLSLTFSFGRNGGPSYTLPTIETKKIESRKRGGPALAIASFCPFCGEAYAPAALAKEQGR